MKPWYKHALIVSAILMAVALVYGRSVGAYYCGYDDFIELHRLEKASPHGVISDFTTTFHGSLKYRPLSMVLNRLTYQAGGTNVAFFRVRNFALQLAAVGFFYGIAMLLFGSPVVAAASALLFGLHPLASQAALGAVWNTMFCYATAFLTVLLFLYSLRARRPLVWLTVTMFVAWINLMAYDAELAPFGMTYAYLAIAYVAGGRRLPVDRRYVLLLSVLTLIFVGCYFTLRALYLPPGTPAPVSLAGVVENVVVYSSAPAMLIDPVLANAWLGTPFPSQVLRGDVQPLWIVIAVAPLLALLLLAAYTWKHWRARIRCLHWPQLAFLLVAAAGAVSPFLFFNPHPSETYIYTPLAFCLLGATHIAYVLTGGRPAARPPAIFVGCVLLLAILFIPATWVRVGRLAECGDTARAIITTLPGSQWREGQWHVRLAAAPGEPETLRYGFNGYRSIHTIGLPGPVNSVEAVLQTLYGNSGIKVHLLTAKELMAQCGGEPVPNSPCYWVHWDGRISDARGSRAPFFGLVPE